MSREIVTVGQEVHVGDVIGYEGATGFATGCHLHFEVQFDGTPQNPRKYLP
jgi:murein DD-endopeptidase MepM/ murein hydrolase activator NlpD